MSISILPGTNIVHIQYCPHLPDNFVETIQPTIQQVIVEHNTFAIHLDLKGLNITTLVQNRGWIESLMGNLDTNSYNVHLTEVLIFNAPFISKQIYAIMSRFVRDIKHKVTFVPKTKGTVVAPSTAVAASRCV
jgi:hypothetical protein